MRKIKFIVTVDLNKFEFESGAEALKFAEFAAQNFVPGTYRDKIDVYISIKAEEPEEPEDPEDD